MQLADMLIKMTAEQLKKTHLITDSSNINFSENLTKERPFGRRNRLFNWNFLYIQLNLTPLEHYQILASYSLLALRASQHLLKHCEIPYRILRTSIFIFSIYLSLSLSFSLHSNHHTGAEFISTLDI